AVVEHHGQLRNVVPCGGPQHAWCVHEIAVGLDVDREAAEIAVGERRADRGRGAVPHAISSRCPQPLIMLLHRPQPVRPVETNSSDQSRSFMCAQISIDMRAVLIGLASQASAAACLVRSRASANAFLAASPRFSMAALRSAGIAAFTASISTGSVASASAAI